MSMAAHYIDSGSEDYSVEAAISKVFASEALQRSAYEALQDLGKIQNIYAHAATFTRPGGYL